MKHLTLDSRSRKSKSPPLRKKGFTLIEVVVAIGIVATVFVAFMGMLPIGISTMKEANLISTQARIAQKLIGEMQLSDWRGDKGGLDDFVTKEYNYDEFGNLTKSESETIYRAVVDVSEGRDEEAPRLPGGSPNDFLRQIEVKVAYAPTGKDIDFEDTESPDIASYVALVVDLEKRTNN